MDFDIDLLSIKIEDKDIELKEYRYDNLVEFHYDGYFIFYVNRFLSTVNETGDNILLIGISDHFRRMLTQKKYDEMVKTLYYNNSITILNIFIIKHDLGIIIRPQSAYSVLAFISSVKHFEHMFMFFINNNMVNDKNEFIDLVRKYYKKINPFFLLLI